MQQKSTRIVRRSRSTRPLQGKIKMVFQSDFRTFFVNDLAVRTKKGTNYLWHVNYSLPISKFWRANYRVTLNLEAKKTWFACPSKYPQTDI